MTTVLGLSVEVTQRSSFELKPTSLENWLRFHESLFSTTPLSLSLSSFAVSFSIQLSIGRKKTRLVKERKKEEWETTSRENGDAVIVEDAEREFLFPDTIEANYFHRVTPFNWCFLIDHPRSVRNTNFRCSNSVSRLSFGTWNPSYSIQSGTLLRMSLCFPL